MLFAFSGIQPYFRFVIILFLYYLTILLPMLECLSVIVGPIANLKGHYFQPSLSVCLSVCLCVCVSLTGTSTLQR